MSWLTFLMANRIENLWFLSQQNYLIFSKCLPLMNASCLPLVPLTMVRAWPTTWPRWRHSFRTGWWEANASWYPWLDWHVQTTVESLITRTPKIRASPFIGTFSMAPATQCVQNFPWNEDTSFNQDRLCCPKAVHNRDRGSTVAGNQQGL